MRWWRSPAVIRGLAEMALHDYDAGVPAPATSDDALRLASWQAARGGLGSMLIMPATGVAAPAADVRARTARPSRPRARR